MSEVEGTVQGHRDGHGFVVRDDRQPDLYLSPQEMRAVLHRDRVRARVIRVDRKGRPEGRVLEIIERLRAPIIGRLLNESGVWLVAPEDRRYGHDILIPKNAVANAVAGQVVVIELTEPPSMYSQPVGRVTEVLGDVDDPGMEIEIAVRKYEVPYRFSAENLYGTSYLRTAISISIPGSSTSPSTSVTRPTGCEYIDGGSVSSITTTCPATALATAFFGMRMS